MRVAIALAVLAAVASPSGAGAEPRRPAISGANALMVLRGEVGPVDDAAVARQTRLMMLEHPATPSRLVYEVRDTDWLARASWRGYVDAETGELLFRENLVARSSRHRARVFDVNPVVDEGQLTEVTFDRIPDASDLIDDGEIEVLNCIDTRSCREVKTAAGIRNIHYCETVPTAIAADDGYLSVEPGGDTELEDSFAEVQGYYHLRKALDYFQGLSPGFALAHKLTAVVNHRIPDLTSTASRCDGATARADSELSVEDNAYFWPAGDIGPTDLGDRILLSQGELADWAYDGEVVYHEFTHAVMHTTTPLAWYRHDSRGIDFSPGGLHEGFSDYFSAAMTNSAVLNLYAGKTEEGPAPLGDLGKTERCTDKLVGEEHEESLAWSNALWVIRRGLRSAARRAAFDRAMFRVISSLQQFDGFPEAVALVLSEMEADPDLGDQRDRAEQLFADRGLPDCGGRVQVMAPGDVKPELYAKGPNTIGVPKFSDFAYPAGMQFALEIPADTTGIRMIADSSFELDEEIKAPEGKRVPRMRLLAKAGGEPIAWTWRLPDGTNDAVLSADVELDEGEFPPATATLRGEFLAGGVVHLQITNAGADWGLEGIHFAIADADGSFDDDKADDLGGGAGGCQSGSGGSGGFGLLGLLGLLAVIRKRR